MARTLSSALVAALCLCAVATTASAADVFSFAVASQTAETYHITATSTSEFAASDLQLSVHEQPQGDYVLEIKLHGASSYLQLARDADGTVHAVPASSTTLDVAVDRLTGQAFTDRMAVVAEKRAALGPEAATQRLPAVRATPLPSSTGFHEDTTADHVVLVLPVPEGSTADDLMFTTSGNTLFTEITDSTRLFSVKGVAFKDRTTARVTEQDDGMLLSFQAAN